MCLLKFTFIHNTIITMADYLRVDMMDKVGNTNFEMVGEFMTAFGQTVKTKAELADTDTAALRVDLIAEELKELKEAIADNNLVEIADALTDLLYVVYGAGHAYGINLDTCFREVHASNMSKLGADGKPIYREDGKVLKGPNFFEPELEEIVFPPESPQMELDLK